MVCACFVLNDSPGEKIVVKEHPPYGLSYPGEGDQSTEKCIREKETGSIPAGAGITSVE